LAAGLITVALITCIVVRFRGDVVGKALHSLAGGHTRVVWAQDMGTSPDLSARSWELRLMGFDSDDGLGARPILNKIASYARPLISPKGDRILLSSRRDNQIYIVNWDGSGLRPLIRGFALDLWMDSNGVEWMYFGDDPKHWLLDIYQERYSAVLRCPIDAPEKVELVWNKSLLNLQMENNFQVSDDGLHASLFCSNRCGVADLPNGDWTEYGSGSCPSMVSDKQTAFFYLNEDQRTISMFNSGPSSRQDIAVCNARGVDGERICQPRWGNDVHLFALAGPLKGPGDEKELEIYVGHFDNQFTDVDEWVQISRNRRPDFIPDVWVEKKQKPVSAFTGGCRGLTWPVHLSDVEFIWETADCVEPVYRVKQEGAVSYGSHHEMILNGGTISAERSMGDMVAHCRKGNEFTLEAVVTAASDGSGNILSFRNDSIANFSLSVRKGHFVFHLRTSDAPEGKDLTFAPCTPGQMYRVAVTYSPGLLTAFVDGHRVLISKVLRGNLGNWQDGNLVFGGSDWRGAVEGVGLYSRRLYGREITLNAYLYGLRVKSRYFVERARRQAEEMKR